MLRSIKRSPSIDKAPRQDSTSFSEPSTRVGTFITNVFEITLLHYDLQPYVIDSADRLNTELLLREIRLETSFVIATRTLNFD